MCWAEGNIVYPTGNTNFTNGDTAKLIITSDLSTEELQSLVHTKITKTIYVLSFKIDRDEKFFKVIFTPPPQKDAKKSYPFVVRGIDYNFDKARIPKDFNFFSSDYKPSANKSSVVLGTLFFLGSILMIIFGLLISSSIKLSKFKSIAKKRSHKLIDKFNNASTRLELEDLYKHKKDYFLYTCLDQNLWMIFEKELNKVQFRESWTSTELDSLLKKKNNIGEIGRRDGV